MVLKCHSEHLINNWCYFSLFSSCGPLYASVPHLCVCLSQSQGGCEMAINGLQWSWRRKEWGIPASPRHQNQVRSSAFTQCPRLLQCWKKEIAWRCGWFFASDECECAVWSDFLCLRDPHTTCLSTRAYCKSQPRTEHKCDFFKWC